MENQKILIKGLSSCWGIGGEKYLKSTLGDYPEATISGINEKNGVIEYTIEDQNEIYHLTDLNSNVLTCIKCKDQNTILEECKNCGDAKHFVCFEGLGGKFTCRTCDKEHHQKQWVCSKCGCENPIHKTLSHWVKMDGPHKKGYCFIATVCYGNSFPNEIIELQRFRDVFLLKYCPGRLFVKFYYFISPLLASLVDKSEVLKDGIRIFILKPIVCLIKKIDLNR